MTLITYVYGFVIQMILRNISKIIYDEYDLSQKYKVGSTSTELYKNDFHSRSLNDSNLVRG